MSAKYDRRGRTAGLVCTLLFSIYSCSTATAQDLYKPFRLILGEPLDIHHRQKPHTAKCDPIETLANEIDWLEAHLDAWGTVVAKKPDIWGEARLTKYRDEYERIMHEELDDFHLRLNASIRTADSAFLMNSFALAGAANGAKLPEANANAIGPGASATVTLPTGSFVGFEGNGVGLEPEIVLNQQSRYLDHLHELRRIHEGDDTSDSPGYSLNLVRIPVSVLPGKKTREGFGSEITITATPVVSEALLGDAMQNLVINDLVDMLSLPVLRYSEQYAFLEAVTPVGQMHKEKRLAHDKREPLIAEQAFQRELEYRTSSGGPRNRVARFALTPQRIRTDLGMEWIDTMREMLDYHYHGRDVRWSGGGAEVGPVPADAEQRMHLLDIEQYMKQQWDAAYALITRPDNIPLLKNVIELSPDGHTLAHAILESRKEYVAELRFQFYDALREHRSFLCEEVGTSDPKVIQDILNLDNQPLSDHEKQQRRERIIAHKLSSAQLLAWPVVVELALLSEYLHEDMIRVAASKNCGCLPARQLPYYLPLNCLSPESPFREEYLEAATAFQEYVRCRWPIHVFALDPVEQEQNVGDILQRRRELQLAMSLAFMNGTVSANNLTRFARTIETQIETVALNRTAVGFSHGADTFGWRFTPRVQTPPTPGNLVAFGQTLFGGPSRDRDLAQRQIEPGIRECVAIVLMPSFVPYCDFDIRSNWFKLCNPKNTEISMHDTMVLSRSIRAMQNSAAQCSNCQHLYRDGEVPRLLKRVHQLDESLPLQTMRVQVPFENTLGGFEMFNTGMTDLAPELRGWYGAPGVVVGGDAVPCVSQPSEAAVACVKAGEECKLASTALPLCPGVGTTLFLVGKNLSVHDTRFLAGGVCIPHHRLISREILQVTIPPCVQTVVIEGQRYVDVHAATPYGVTGHLHIPVVEAAPSEAQITERVATKVISELGLPRLKLESSAPLQFVARVDQQGQSAVGLHTSSENILTTIKLEDHYPQFSETTGQPMAIHLLASIGKDKKLLSKPVELFPQPLALNKGEIKISADQISNAISAALVKLSQSTQMAGKSDDLEFDLVLYYLLEGTNFPQQIEGLGKLKLHRDRVD